MPNINAVVLEKKILSKFSFFAPYWAQKGPSAQVS